MAVKCLSLKKLRKVQEIPNYPLIKRVTAMFLCIQPSFPHFHAVFFTKRAQEIFPQTSLFHIQGSSTSTDHLMFLGNPLFPAILLAESNTTWSRSLPHFQHYTDYLERQPAAPTQALTLSGAYHSAPSGRQEQRREPARVRIAT